jgi:hypothetical protein
MTEKITLTNRPFNTTDQLSSPPAPPPPPKGLGRRVGDATKKKIWDGAKGVAGGAKKIWDSGKWVAGGAKKIWDGGKWVWETASPEVLKTRFKQAIEQALIGQIPQQLVLLKEIIHKFIHNPDNVTFDDVESAHQYIEMLFAENNKMLNLLAPGMSEEDKKLFTRVLKTLQETADQGDYDNITELEKHAESFRKRLKSSDGKQLYKDFNKLFNKILDQNQGEGAIPSTLTYIKEALLSEKEGLIKQSMNQLTQLLNQKDGPMAALRQQVSGKDNSVLSDAIKLFNNTLLGQPDKNLLSLKDALNKFNDPENIQFADLTVVYGHMKSLLDDHNKISEPLASELQKDEKTLFYNILHDVEECVQGTEYDDLGQLQTKAKSFSEKFKEPELKKHLGNFTKTLDDILSRDKGSLEKALDSLRKAFLSEGNGLVKQVMDQLREQLSGADDSVLRDTINLLRESLFSAKDGMVTRFFYEVTNKERGLLVEALKVLEHGINGDNGLLTKAMDALEQRVTDEENGIIARAFAYLNKKLKEEEGPFEYIEFRLTDKEVGVLTKAVNFVEQKFVGKGGLIDQVSEKIAEPAHPLLATSRAKMSELYKAIIANNKPAIKKCSETLYPLLEQLAADRATVFTKQPLLDSDLARLNGLKNKLPSFFAENSLSQEEMRALVASGLTTVNSYYKHAGMAEHTMDVLGEAVADTLNSSLSRLDEKLTEPAHPLLATSRAKMSELYKAIIANNKAAIKRCSVNLHPLLEQLTANHKTVFTKQPLQQSDFILLDELKNKLSSFYAENPPSQREMSELVAFGLAAVNRYYSDAGIAEHIGGALRVAVADALDPPLSRLEGMLSQIEDLPKTWLGLKKTPSAQTDTAPTDGPPQEGTLPDFLSQGSSILQAIMQKGGQAVSKQVLNSFCSVLSLGLKQAWETIKDNSDEAYSQPKADLQELINRVETLSRSGDLSQLYSTLENATPLFNGLNLCINGFSIPRIGYSAEHPSAALAYSNNIARLEEAIDPRPQEPENADWKELAKVEQKKLVINTVNFLTIKHIFENVCHLKAPGEKFYLQLLSEARKAGQQSESELKKLFFEALDKRKIHFLTKLHAEIQYYFYGSIIKRFIRKASNIYFKEIFQYIEKHKADHFTTLRNQITTNSTRYLTILGGAYQNVAGQVPTGTLEEMLKKELEKKDSNLGFDTKQLYLEFAHSVLKKTLKSSILSWFGKKIIGNPEQIVRTIIDTTTQSLQDAYGYGYTNALNTLIREQLDEIWTMLQAAYSSEQSGQSPNLQSEVSDIKKEQLSRLVKNLFEILRKAQCDTVDELQELLQGKSLSAKIHKTIDDLFIKDVLEQVTNILALSLESIIKEDQLQKLTYQFASLANRAFEIDEEEENLKIEQKEQRRIENRKQMQSEEHRIYERCEQILRLATTTAVEDKFDFSGKKEQTKTNNLIQKIRTSSHTYFSNAEQDLKELSQMQDKDFATPIAQDKIHKLIQETHVYQSNCHASHFEAKSSRMSFDNKDEISQRHSGIAEQSKPLVGTIATLKEHAKTLADLQTFIPNIQAVKKIIPSIELRLFKNSGANLQDIDFAEKQMNELQLHLEVLKKAHNIAEQIEKSVQNVQIIATILVNMRKAIALQTFGLELAKADSPMNQVIADHQKRILGQPIDRQGLNAKMLSLRQELTQSVNSTWLPQLLDKLKNIQEATQQQQVDTAHQEFQALLKQAINASSQSIQDGKGQYEISVIQINQAIEATTFLDPATEHRANHGIRQTITTAQQQLRTLSEWEEEQIKSIPYINLSTSDLMKRIQDWASGIVYNRVKQRMDGFIGFIKREETYRYGILNHLFLIPYVQSLHKLS